MGHIMPDRIPSSQASPTRVPFDQMRFRVALSFPGEKRSLVEDVALRLAENLPRKEIFYDNWYQPHLARPSIDLTLQDIYHKRSELLVVFLCAEYEKKEWCGVEWRAIRDLIKQRKNESVMLVRLDDAPVSGLLSGDGFLDARQMASDELADCILERLGEFTPAISSNAKFHIRSRPGAYVVCALPRGLLVIEDVEPDNNENWSLEANYYHFGEGWKFGTHYHPSYYRDWQDYEAIKMQCAKVRIPEADWTYSHWPFHLMAKIGECESLEEVSDAVASFSSTETFAVLYKEKEEPDLSLFERRHLNLKRTGALRDLYHELDEWRKQQSRSLAEQDYMAFAFSLSYRLTAELSRLLGSDHPSFLLVSGLLQKHNEHKTRQDLFKWLDLVEVALIDSIQLAAKDAITRK